MADEANREPKPALEPRPDPTGSGFYFIQSLLNGTNGNVIDIQGASTADGAPLDAWPMKPTGNDNQLWQVITVFAAATPPFLIKVECFPNNKGEPGPLGAPFSLGPNGFVIVPSGATPPQSEYPTGSGNYQVTVPNGTVLTLNPGMYDTVLGYAIVNAGGVQTNQLISVNLPQSAPPNVIFIGEANVLPGGPG
jgi:hypothetical protein